MTFNLILTLPCSFAVTHILSFTLTLSLTMTLTLTSIWSMTMTFNLMFTLTESQACLDNLVQSQFRSENLCWDGGVGWGWGVQLKIRIGSSFSCSKYEKLN